MASDPLVNSINDSLDEEIARISEQIALGNINTFDEYKRRAGVIVGLKMAKDIVFSSSKRYLDDNEEST